MTDTKKYLQPDVVARLANLEMVARFVVEGFITGLHKSPYHGFSVEFAEHRQYMPGDEIRSIDWKVYGRTSRFYVKRFEEETNLKCHIVLDTSASMTFGTGAVNKLQYGGYLAASLAYLMIHQKDAAGLAVFDRELRKYLPPRATLGYIKTIEEVLQNISHHETTRIAENLHVVAERIKRRGLVILISDLLDEAEDVVHALRHFRHDGHEVIVFHVLDHSERTLDFEGDVIFDDLETREQVATQPWHIRKAYAQEVESFCDYYRRRCRESRVDYVLLDTKTPFDVALREYIAKRSKIGG